MIKPPHALGRNTSTQTSTKEYRGLVLKKKPKISIRNRKFSEKQTIFWKDFRIFAENKQRNGKKSENK